MSGLGYLEGLRPKILMFCGKGGVGKTTCASATALHFSRNGKRVLLISTDPSPSLSDIFELDVRGRPKEVADGLDVVELDYDLVVEMWKDRFGEEVYEVVSSFLPVDKGIIDYVAEAPGIDEEFALSYLLDFYKGGRYDLIVWDTAPAGGTLSLLTLQDKFYRHLLDAARLYVRVKRALDLLVKGEVRRDPLDIISDWEELSKDVLDMVRGERTFSLLVTIAEGLGVKQTERVAKELERFGVKVAGLIVNYIAPKDAGPFYEKRFEMQMKYVKELKVLFPSLPMTLLEQLPEEVKGLERIAEVSEMLFGDDRNLY